MNTVQSKNIIFYLECILCLNGPHWKYLTRKQLIKTQSKLGLTNHPLKYFLLNSPTQVSRGISSVLYAQFKLTLSSQSRRGSRDWNCRFEVNDNGPQTVWWRRCFTCTSSVTWSPSPWCQRSHLEYPKSSVSVVGSLSCCYAGLSFLFQRLCIGSSCCIPCSNYWDSVLASKQVSCTNWSGFC